VPRRSISSSNGDTRGERGRAGERPLFLFKRIKEDDQITLFNAMRALLLYSTQKKSWQTGENRASAFLFFSLGRDSRVEPHVCIKTLNCASQHTGVQCQIRGEKDGPAE